MRREELTRALVEETLAKINPLEIPTKNLPKSGVNQLAYYLLYDNEFYPPKYVVNQCGYDSDNVNSIEANSVLKSLGFEICDSNTNQKVLKIILKNFYKRALEGNVLDTVDITRRVTYKGFKVHASFGKGKFATTPFIVFLKDNNTSQKGVYPFTHFDRRDNSLHYGLGLSIAELPEIIQELSISLNETVESVVLKIKKDELYKSDIVSESNISEEDLDYIINKIDHYIEEYNNLFFTILEKREKIPKEKILKEFPLNQILFGPPGTGKTYNTIDKAIEIIEQRFVNDDEREDLVKSFNKYKEEGQIVFTTFHQSFGYEEFIEGLRSNECGSFAPVNGIFKDLCDRARNDKFESLYEYLNKENVKAYKLALGNLYGTDSEIFKNCLENNTICFNYQNLIDLTELDTEEKIKSKLKEKYTDVNGNYKFLQDFRNDMKIGDLIFATNENSKYKAIGIVKGNYFYENKVREKYCHSRDVQWLYTSLDLEYKKTNDDFVLHKIQKNTLNENKQFLLEKTIEVEKSFIMIIDEINRGNISKIFGELITLIEDDKREGAENELSVILPYSKERFSIPANVYILGTMNTADRSIALLDTALRRRFAFIEMMPQSNRLDDNIVEGIELSEVLTVINDRIEYLFDREHTIGHAYFINCNTFEELQQAMRNKVIPLLQEYFYDEWEKIELVLGGCGNENTKDHFFIYKKELNKDIFNKNSKLSDFIEENKAKYFISPNPSKNAFLNLMGNENEDN